jgi:hypothetical protein
MGDNYDWMGNVQSMGLFKNCWKMSTTSLSAIGFWLSFVGSRFVSDRFLGKRLFGHDFGQ